ncbi:MAG: response regulator transcription factor [Planctomycetes bacterium]|nr:response regulator transcription factor [Planctomycetota bacterium]
MRVLVVEDYEPMRTALIRGLRDAAFAVDPAENGSDGLWLARSNDYDVIVLDIMLPDIDGISLLKRLRAEKSKSRVILLTARDSIEDRVAGLDRGADDYLTKPFAFEELLARIRSLVRRHYDVPNPVIRIGDLEIDTTNRSVRRNGFEIELTRLEFALLTYLAMRRGEVVTRTDIWENLYEFESSNTSNVVDVYIRYLRKKIEIDGTTRLIHTRRGFGYVLDEKEST